MSETDTARHIYDTAFLPEHDGMGFESFRRKLRQWKKHTMADDDTLNAGTYAGFTTHDATVQVDGKGVIRQAWIKQSSGDVDWQEVISAIKEATQPIEAKPCTGEPEKAMLEIPLFDMHFGIAKLSDYIREIHTGHLHRESVDNGTMVRRLASGVPTDAWNSKNGFMGVNKRFQLFEWEPGLLAGIKYV